jgi:hypothetical protein
MNFWVPPVEYIVTPCSFSFFTIGSNQSLLKTDIKADLTTFSLLILRCVVVFI